MGDMEKLTKYLNSLEPGAMTNHEVLERLVFECWHKFEGGNQEKMEGYKILHRMENARWNPPILSFVMERHPQTVAGSIWANLQEWKLNIETMKADCEMIGRRQVSAMEPRLNVRPLAEETAQLIFNHVEDERLKWNKDGTVRVQIGKIIPAGSIKGQTLAGRRKRFRKAVEELLAYKGWQEVRLNVYAPPRVSDEKI
jgi:hypothetical protein